MNPQDSQFHETILIVDDDTHVREDLHEILAYHKYTCVEARDGKEALQIITNQPIDLVLLDLKLPRIDGLEVLKQGKQKKPDLPFIIISGQGTIQAAVEATKAGAFDFVEKPLDADRILLRIRNALEKRHLQRERDQLLQEARNRYRMVGNSARMQEVYALIDRAARVDSKVLITGESGTGKELVARAIHLNSKRATHPFVPMNCSAIPDALIESELFGHVKGSFTGAVRNYPGKFMAANKGTLFLDEIGDMNMAMQAKLLRAMEDQAIFPVGGTEPHDIDVRIICATHKDLPTLIEEGRFREDLYYRINVIQIHLPPLRERTEDIQPLAEFFLQEICNREGWPEKTFSPAVWPILRTYHWPGNVRELRNIVERVAVIAPGTQIEAHLVTEVLENVRPTPFEPERIKPLREARQEFEREYIRHALIVNNKKILATARAIGLQRSHLWKKLKQLGINPKNL